MGKELVKEKPENNRSDSKACFVEDDSWEERLAKEGVAIHCAEHSTSVHSHDFIEIVYFTSGVGTHYVGGKIYEVSSGCVCVMNNNVRHYYGADSDYCDKLAVKNLVFYPKLLGCSFDNFLYEFSIKKVGLSEDQAINNAFLHSLKDPDREIEQYFALIEKELKMKKTNYQQIVKCLVETIILLLVSGRGIINEEGRYNRSYLKIEESINYLNEHIQNLPTMLEVAKRYGLSPEYYSKLFRNFTGKSYIQFVQEMKCNEACRLLVETDYTNETIATMSGFRSLKHFYQQFKKCKGITPREYMKLKNSN